MNTGEFRKKLLQREPLVGTFLKTPSAIVAEVLSLSELDVFCIDTEHAPFGRVEADQCIGAFRALDRPCLIRVADDSPREIRTALDAGATGLLVPHVTSGEQAAAIVKAARFGEGGRGYAGSSRAANYTTKNMTDHIHDSHAKTAIVLQIEDLAALDELEAIAGIDGVDCLFIGRVDLAVAMGKTPMDTAVIETIQQICETTAAAGTAVGMYTPDLAELKHWRSIGASLFLLDSDQGFVLAGARKLAMTFKEQI